jgi:membrane protease YdiL (CAAX protease family)
VDALDPGGLPPPPPEPPDSGGLLPLLPGGGPVACAACGRTLKAGAGFCGSCGHRVGDPPPALKRKENFLAIRNRVAREWREVSFVITFYVVMLVIQVVAGVAVRAGAEEFTALVVGDILLAAAVVVIVMAKRLQIVPLLNRPGFGPLLYGAIALASVPVYLLIHLFVLGLQAAFHVETPRCLDAFEGRAFWWPLLIVCVNAAVFEELAFRGVIFGVLRKHVGLQETMLITAAAFAILHLSAFALVSHTLMGLYFGWLRYRSESLYPAMLAHFLHNALALANEYWHILPSGGVS